MKVSHLWGVVLGGMLCFPSLEAAEVEEKIPPMHHLVKVKPPAAMKIPKTFPLNGRGEIDCETCHGIENIAKMKFDEVDKKAENFHRGGPYENLSDFCYRCHDESDYQRPNVHELLDQQGKYDEKACLYCHEEAPEPEKDYEMEALKLRLPLQKICLGCHLKTPHLNALGHLRRPNEEMRRRMEKSKEELQVIFPLDGEGRVTCVTCHAPHQRGVIDPRKAAGKQVAGGSLDEGVVYIDHPWSDVFIEDKRRRLEQWAEQYGDAPSLPLYRRIEKEVLLRLPAKNGRLCLACHEFER